MVKKNNNEDTNTTLEGIVKAEKPKFLGRVKYNELCEVISVYKYGAPVMKIPIGARGNANANIIMINRLRLIFETLLETMHKGMKKGEVDVTTKEFDELASVAKKIQDMSNIAYGVMGPNSETGKKLKAQSERFGTVLNALYELAEKTENVSGARDEEIIEAEIEEIEEEIQNAMKNDDEANS